MAKGSNKAGTPKSNPKHSNDKNRANSVSKDGMRSASTVSGSAEPACTRESARGMLVLWSS